MARVFSYMWERLLPGSILRRNTRFHREYMGWTMGLEPTTAGTTIRSSTN